MATKTRIQVYTDPETKRRIDLAAAKYEASVTEYCVEAIRQRLAEDGVLEEEQVEVLIEPRPSSDLIADLRALRERIKAAQGGKLLDLDTLLEDLHNERDDELFAVR